jgi:hypothetical protein
LTPSLGLGGGRLSVRGLQDGAQIGRQGYGRATAPLLE